MREVQTGGHMAYDADRLFERQWSGAQPFGERAAFEPRHHEVCAVGFPPEVVERHAAGVLQPSYQLRLCLEAPDEIPFDRQLLANDLDRDLAANGRLSGSVDDRIRPLTDPVAQAVTAQLAAASVA